MLAKRFGRSSAYTLFVVIGEAYVECGVRLGSASRGAWVADSRLEFAIDPQTGFQHSVAAVAQAVRELQATLGLHSFSAIRVIVADSWLAVMGVPWSPAMDGAEGGNAYVRSLFSMAGHVVEVNDVVKLDDAPFGAPRLVVAFPHLLLGALDQLARDCKASLTSVLPWSVAAWALARRAGDNQLQALALLSRGLLLVMRAAVGDSRLGEVTVRRSISGQLPDGAALDAVWRRLCLRETHFSTVQKGLYVVLDDEAGKGIDVSQPFVRLDLPLDCNEGALSPALTLAAEAASSCSPLDARELGGQRATRGQWAVLTGLVVLVSGLFFSVAENNQTLSLLMARLNAAAELQQPKMRAVNWSRDELIKVQAVNVAIRELNLPISALLQALEPPADIRVAVLAIEAAGGVSNSRDSSLRIQAEARSGDEMARYVGFLSNRKPFTGAYLTKHEIVDESVERSYRFTVEVSWDS